MNLWRFRVTRLNLFEPRETSTFEACWPEAKEQECSAAGDAGFQPNIHSVCRITLSSDLLTSERPKSIQESNSQKGPSRNTTNEVSHQLPAFPVFCSVYVGSSEFFEVQLFICCETRLFVFRQLCVCVLSLSQLCEKRDLNN